MKESEIRPRDLFDRYLELSRRDIQRLFSDRSAFEVIPCPACGHDQRTLAFKKLGFDYQICSACGSLYVSPRPTSAMQGMYIRESEAVRFWNTRFYRETSEVRRAKVFRPRADLVAQLVSAGLVPKSGVLVDIGAGYGIFLQEIARLRLFVDVLGIEPVPDLARSCRIKGFKIVQKVVETVTPGEVVADVATAFEVLEHVFDPQLFLRACRETLRPGGYLLFTSLTISGFDLQVLWDHSKSIYPPHHINLLSLEGLRVLVKRCGLELVELSTPGKLDVDIVANALAENPTLPLPRFVRYLLTRRGPTVLEAFQSFLEVAELSSHVRVLARRPI